RARSWRRLRPGRRRCRSAGRLRIDRRAHDPTRRHRRRAQQPRPGHRSRADHDANPDDLVSENPSVFIVDDHQLFRSGVRAELGDAVDVVGDADEVAAAVELIAERKPDVVLVDVHMPDGGGRAVIEAVSAVDPNIRFLAISVSDAAEDVISVIRAGARGYVTKTISGPELADAIGRVAEGDAVFSPRLAGFVLDAFGNAAGGGGGRGAQSAGTAHPDPELDQLTNREREVLRLIARGYAYKEIARRLEISIKTVETHVSAVLRKLQLSSRYELTRWAADRRLT